MREQTERKYNWINYILVFALLTGSVLATIKFVILGVDVDEQYAVTMAYRMLRGDRMFLEMWEPHQTSGFLAALFMKLFLVITGDVKGIVIYLRIVGVLIQGLIAFWSYDTMKRYCSRLNALFAALFLYNTMPKYSPIPEFANMLVWFSVLAFLCLMQYFAFDNRKKIWLILSGICVSGAVLSYPSSVLMVFPICFGIMFLSQKKECISNLFYFIGTCCICAILYIGYFLSHMSFGTFLNGLRNMLSDGSHSSNFYGKICGYAGDVKTILPHLLVSLFIALLAWIFLKIILKISAIHFGTCLLTIACLEQIYVWFFQNHYMKFPLLFYPIIVIEGVVRYIKREKFGIAKEHPVYRAAFWFGSFTSLWILLSAFIASNVRIYESSEYMMIGMFAALAFFEYERREVFPWWILVSLSLLSCALIRRGYLVYYFYGKDTVFVTRQKALEGPLAGVYCRYMDGYNYNNRGDAIRKQVPENSKVMYVGIETLLYLQGEYEVCNFSTISTPIIDEKLFEYWEQYPDKQPEYIIWDKGIPDMAVPAPEIKKQMLDGFEIMYEDEALQIYATVNE